MVIYKEMDVEFIEFYIKKKYKKRLHEYFGVSRTIASTWRNEKFPDGRLMDFVRREGSIDILELFTNLYQRD